MWDKLYNAAVKVQNSRKISPFIDAGGVAAAILTKQGNIYVGVCIDTACTLGMCAERNAIANMITNGESRIDKVVAVMMAKEGIRATNVEGFVHNDLKVTLENLYRLQHDVLHNKVDAILWDIVKEQKVIH